MQNRAQIRTDRARGDLAPPLPHSPDAEAALLGAVLLNDALLASAAKQLDPSAFFLPVNMRVFRRMLAMRDESKPIDLVSLVQEMQAHSELADGQETAYVSSLSQGCVPQSANLEYYARIVQQKAQLRRWAHAGQSLVDAAFDGDFETANTCASRIRESAQGLNGLRALPAEQFLQLHIEPREMLLDPVLAVQDLAMLYGWRGLGKTYFAIGVGTAVAAGGAFLKWRAPKARRVVYVDGELPARTLQERIQMTLSGMESKLAPDMLRIITPDLQDRPMPDLATADGQILLEPHLDGAELLILDNLSALTRTGIENEAESWIPVQDWALRLRRRGISVLFLHHAGKNREQRGTSRREDLLDTVVTLKHPNDYQPSDGLRVEVHFEKARSLRADAAKPFEVRLETDPDGRAVWTSRDSERVTVEQAAELFDSGLSVREIAAELSISKSAAGRLRAEWLKAKTVPET